MKKVINTGLNKLHSLLGIIGYLRGSTGQHEGKYLSCPAVSQICKLVFSPSTSILFTWKSTPKNRTKWPILTVCVCVCARAWDCASAATHPVWSECRPWTGCWSASAGSSTFPLLRLQPEPDGTLEQVRLWPPLLDLDSYKIVVLVIYKDCFHFQQPRCNMKVLSTDLWLCYWHPKIFGNWS